MSQRGFWGGILTGGIIGMLVAIAVAPQLKPETRDRIMRTSKEWSGRAGKAFRRSRTMVKEAADNLR